MEVEPCRAQQPSRALERDAVSAGRAHHFVLSGSELVGCGESTTWDQMIGDENRRDDNGDEPRPWVSASFRGASEKAIKGPNRSKGKGEEPVGGERSVFLPRRFSREPLRAATDWTYRAFDADDSRHYSI
jgi:hypothetical protein